MYDCNAAVVFRLEDWNKINRVIESDWSLSSFFHGINVDTMSGRECRPQGNTLVYIDWIGFRWYHERNWKQKTAVKHLYQLLEAYPHDIMVCGEKPSDVYIHKDLDILIEYPVYPKFRGEPDIKHTKMTMDRIIRLAIHEGIKPEKIADCFPTRGKEYIERLFSSKTFDFKESC